MTPQNQDAPKPKKPRNSKRLREVREAKRNQVVQAFELGHTVEGAARLAGVNPQTIHRWMNEDERFGQRCIEAKDRADDRVEAVTYNLACDPNPANNGIRVFWLRCRRPEIYADKARLQVTHQVAQLSDDELIRRATGLLGGTSPQGLDGPTTVIDITPKD